MRLWRLLLFLVFFHLPATSVPPPGWTYGFWYWEGSSARVRPEAGAVDVAYLHGGKIQRHEAGVYSTPISTGYWRSLPAAREYWVVFRYEPEGLPAPSLVPQLVQVLHDQVAELKKRAIPLRGVQLDVDCPTARLPEYAQFLAATRKALPAGMELSITALLDWFRPATAIAQVVAAVDEFVPQFYDLGDPSAGKVAAKIDAARWTPLFHRHHKRFRIGISTFGRARYVPPPAAGQSRFLGIRSVPDVQPSQLAGRPGFQLQTNTAPTGERLLTFRALRRMTFGYTSIDQGDTYEFTLATPESVRDAVAQAKKMGPYCAGVVFFRWPAAQETMALTPQEALEAAGAVPPLASGPSVQSVDGSCAAVACSDVYILGLPRLLAHETRYRIHSSEPLEYFLPFERAPGERVPARMASPTTVELRLPAYASQGRMLIGRLVTSKKTALRIEAIE